MALTYDAPAGSSSWTVAYNTETKIIQYPQRGIGAFDAYIVREIYVQRKANWTYLAVGTAHPGISASLFEESEPESIGAGLVRWERKYGSVPSDYSTYAMEAVTFPGYYSEWDADGGGASSVFRPPLTKVVEIRELHSFDENAQPTDTLVPTQKLQIQNARNEYVDYVDDNTTKAGSGYTYADYLVDVAAGTEYVFKEPILQRVYGAGDIWELIEFFVVPE